MLKLHEMDPCDRFSDRAKDYARYRPDYPDECIRWILAGFGDPRSLLAVDVGAGTGISSRRLAEHGVRVVAVEPNPSMRAVSEAHPRVQWIESPAENLPLSDQSADLITCFQAFHWFQPDEALSEFSRLLKPSGRLAIIWNERDSTDRFTEAYGDLVRKLSDNHPAERREQTIEPLLKSPLFQAIRNASFRCGQRLDLEGLIGRARSASYLPGSGSGFEDLVRSLTQLHRAWTDGEGQVTLVYRTAVYLADPVSSCHSERSEESPT